MKFLAKAAENPAAGFQVRITIVPDRWYTFNQNGGTLYSRISTHGTEFNQQWRNTSKMHVRNPFFNSISSIP
jgi:hypothetical protein